MRPDPILLVIMSVGRGWGLGVRIPETAQGKKSSVQGFGALA